MKYFAKYLPIEGEIKEGDLVIGMDGIFEYKGKVNIPDIELPKKTKLFLCSRDIQIGDTYYYSDTETDVCDSEIRLEQIKEQEEKHGFKRFKVIGEISPEATWVKEGDEFMEDEIYTIHQALNGTNWVRVHASVNEDYLGNKIEIRKFFLVKGPCGHFH